jgi:hypothetical protein
MALLWAVDLSSGFRRDADVFGSLKGLSLFMKANLSRRLPYVSGAKRAFRAVDAEAPSDRRAPADTARYGI